MPDFLDPSFWLPLLVAMTAFCVMWPISVMRRDASLVDLIWGPGFIVQLGTALAISDNISSRGWLLLCLVGAWSVRLSFVLSRRRFREGHEDARYTAIRESWGAGFWWKSLFIVFVLQAFLQWSISLGPISGAVAPDLPLGGMAMLGFAIAVSGLVLESMADRELDIFKRDAPPGALLETGLRAHVRHPNYMGEILFWIGVALICVEGGAALGILSPVLMTFFLTKVSGAPLLDERLSATRPAYREYRKRVPAFLPALRGRSPQ